MKRKIIFGLLAMLLPLTGAAATASLSIDPSFDIKAGEEKEMVINLSNPDDIITLVQFDLSLPTDLSIKKVNGEYDIDIAGRTTWKKHSLDANAQADGTIRFLLASSSNKELTGSEGAIIKMTLVADGSFTGGDIKLKNILLVTPEEKEITQSEYTYYVGGTPVPPPTPGTAELSIEPFNITAGGEAEMVIDLTNPDDVITLVQFDLSLPAGLSIKTVGGEYDIDIADRTTWKKHSLDANAQSDGTIRFLLASSSNKELTGSEGAIIKVTLVADGSFTGGDIKLKNILLVTPEEKEITQSEYTYYVGGTPVPPPTPGTAELSIEPFNITAGGEAEMVIDLTNPDDVITLVQFDLSLPAGLSIKTIGEEYNIDISDRTTWRKHSLDASAQADGTIRFLLASSSNIALSGTEGAIIKMTLVANSSFAGGDIKLKNILMVTPEEKEITQSEYTYYVDPTPVPPPTQETAKLSIEPFEIAAGGETEMVIDLSNPDDVITLVQFDLSLPAGLSIKTVGGEYDIDIADRTTWRKHSLDANAQADGTIRFLLASSSNIALSGTEGAIIKMTLVANSSFAGGDIKLKNILMVTPEEKEITPFAVTYHAEISSTDNPEPSVPEGWIKVITNGNLATGDVSSFFKIESGSDLQYATIIEGVGKDNSRGIVIQSGNNPPTNWDTQFFICSSKVLTEGTKMHVEFDYKASQNAKCETQAHGEPGQYKHWECIGEVNFTTEWKHYSKDVVITDYIVNMQSICFVLSFNKTATTYYFDNIVVWIQESPSSVNDIFIESEKASPVYTLSGQRLGKPHKGINVVNGKKVVVR